MSTSKYLIFWSNGWGGRSWCAMFSDNKRSYFSVSTRRPFSFCWSIVPAVYLHLLEHSWRTTMFLFMHFSQETHQQQYTQELKELSLWLCGHIALHLWRLYFSVNFSFGILEDFSVAVVTCKVSFWNPWKVWPVSDQYWPVILLWKCFKLCDIRGQ